LSQQPDYDEIPEVAQIDELQTFVGNKKNKMWLWNSVNKEFAGILAMTIGDRSAETFKPLWKIIKGWKCFFMPQMVMLFIPSLLTRLTTLLADFKVKLHELPTLCLAGTM
jgi:hypothetical protein